ncbi:hypothetical protein OIU79_014395 [Salix purpurea]|uniref:Uncharacterized protein n=1 Tax=Salix purpurea TaxID=77065 RepID=A0A9Q0SX19_SALPP|nr:hypothetical protein OIU79_014395 [Salix purpurea]
MEGSQKPTTEPPYTVLAYQDPRYWNEKFSKEERYEWFKYGTHFLHLIQAQFCGEIYRDGITEITCIDLSAVAFEKMQKRVEAKGNKGLLWNLLLGYSLCFMLNQIGGKRSSGDEGCGGRTKRPSICIFQEEPEGQDFIFRTNIDEDSYRLF